MNDKSFCAIVLARGGSKGIKNKNIVKVNRKPLIYYCLNAANKSKYLDKIFVSTDSEIIKSNVLSLDLKKVAVISRSKKNSQDFSSSEDALLELIQNIDYENIFFMQATNIFINKNIIDTAIFKFINSKYDSILSAIEGKNFAWVKHSNKFVPINYNIKIRPRRQLKKKKFYIENGAFYIFSKKGFIKNKNRLFGKIGIYEMSQMSYFDIDDYEDLKIVKKLLK